MYAQILQDIFFAKAPPLPGTSVYGPLNDCGEAHPKGAKKKVAGSHCPWGGHGNPMKDPNWPYIFGVCALTCYYFR